jgi:two-component system, NarL family, response regulator
MEAPRSPARSWLMRIASVHAIPAPRPIATAIVGGDAPARHRSARLLADAGFRIQEHTPGDEPALVLLLLSRATDAERVGEVRALAESHPETCVLAVMPASATNASLRRVLLAGAVGIVFDNELDRALVPTARSILAGQLTVPTALGRQIAPRPLSHREKQILALVTLGRTNREIAHTLFLAESTVKTHLSSAFRKLDARSRSEAVTRITDPESVYGPSILEIAHGPLAAAR